MDKFPDGSSGQTMRDFLSPKNPVERGYLCGKKNLYILSS